MTSQGLPDYLVSALSAPFEWGKHDCVLFAARWASQRTGIDMLAGVEPWANRQQARQRLTQHGGIRAIVDARLPTIAPALSIDGCIGLYEHHAGMTLGIFSANQLAVPADAGLIFVDRKEAICAWAC